MATSKDGVRWLLQSMMTKVDSVTARDELGTTLLMFDDGDIDYDECADCIIKTIRKDIQTCGGLI